MYAAFGTLNIAFGGFVLIAEVAISTLERAGLNENGRAVVKMLRARSCNKLPVTATLTFSAFSMTFMEANRKLYLLAVLSCGSRCCANRNWLGACVVRASCKALFP